MSMTDFKAMYTFQPDLLHSSTYTSAIYPYSITPFYIFQTNLSQINLPQAFSLTKLGDLKAYEKQLKNISIFQQDACVYIHYNFQKKWCSDSMQSGCS